MTLNALAKAIGMYTHSYLSELESGKKIPTASVILRVARVFDISTDILMKDELELNPKK
jgi:transcriptional regulator with XRE-family HTH domain